MNIFVTRTVGRFSRVWQNYITFTEQKPAKANILNTIVLMTGGDVIAQLALERRSLYNYDLVRTFRFAVVGGALCGPCMHIWYTALDKWVKTGSLMYKAVTKTAADQILFLPAYLAGFVSVMGVLRGDTSDILRKKLIRDFGPLLISSYGVWPPVQLFNFYILPLRHRVFLINIVCLFWNSYIGWQAERHLPHPAEYKEDLEG